MKNCLLLFFLFIVAIFILKLSEEQQVSKVSDSKVQELTIDSEDGQIAKN